MNYYIFPKACLSSSLEQVRALARQCGIQVSVRDTVWDLCRKLREHTQILQGVESSMDPKDDNVHCYWNGTVDYFLSFLAIVGCQCQGLSSGAMWSNYYAFVQNVVRGVRGDTPALLAIELWDKLVQNMKCSRMYQYEPFANNLMSDISMEGIANCASGSSLLVHVYETVAPKKWRNHIGYLLTKDHAQVYVKQGMDYIVIETTHEDAGVDYRMHLGGDTSSKHLVPSLLGDIIIAVNVLYERKCDTTSLAIPPLPLKPLGNTHLDQLKCKIWNLLLGMVSLRTLDFDHDFQKMSGLLRDYLFLSGGTQKQWKEYTKQLVSIYVQLSRSIHKSSLSANKKNPLLSFITRYY
jgi:hypothetical protein